MSEEKKEYRVLVTERHCDYVWVTAGSRKQAMDEAHAISDCEFECLYSCEVVDEKSGEG